MKTLGLTGGVGTGKTTAAELLSQRGAAVVDTDNLARQLVQPGQPAWTEVQQVFGGEIFGPDGQLRRDALAGIVFADATARKRLEEILHPRIRSLWRAQIAAWRNEGKPMAVVVIPLLFETGAEAELDAVICVVCTAATQRQRLLARGWTPEQIEQRLRAQWPIEKKIELADYVVWTEGGLDVLAGQLDRVVAQASRALARG
jgi:dephospho-CoA kinase